MAKPVITQIAPTLLQVGVAIEEIDIAATNAPTEYDAQNLPPGLEINNATGAITGTPTTGGVYYTTIGAYNASGIGFSLIVFTVTPVTNGIYNDGGIVLGCQKVTINGYTYILDDFKPEQDAKEVDSPDEKGLPNRQALLRTKIKGTATAQLASSETPYPPQFATFNANYNGAPKLFVIKKVGEPQMAGEECKVPIDIIEVLNP